MNISRALLLSVSVFFAVPMMASEAPKTETTTTTTQPADANAKGFFGKTKDLAMALAAFPIVTAPKFIADKTYLNAGIKAVTSKLFAQNSVFNTHADKIGTGAVFFAAAAAAIYAYNTLYATEDTTEDNDPIFEENN